MARKIRYAVAGLGWIAQETILPAFQNAEKNSELAALITDNREKAKELGQAYGIPRISSYEEYEELLRGGEVDAVFITLPNSMHREFTVRAARAGVHVLCEKPMAANVEECEAMIRTARDHRVKLMIAYRLHFDPANLKAIEMIRSGRLGDPRAFSAIFCQQVPEGNVRLRRDLAGGPLMDLGVYPINAARYLFRGEPEEVTAFGGNNGEQRFKQVHEAASAILRFPGDRLATFTCSFGAASIDTWSVVGSKGSIRLEPGFGYHKPVRISTTIGESEEEQTVPKHDQFGAELLYFSDCILKNQEPEPSGAEGLADLRIIDGLLESMRTGKAVKLAPYRVGRRPHEQQKIELPPVEPTKMVHANPPSH